MYKEDKFRQKLNISKKLVTVNANLRRDFKRIFIQKYPSISKKNYFKLKLKERICTFNLHRKNKFLSTPENSRPIMSRFSKIERKILKKIT